MTAQRQLDFLLITSKFMPISVCEYHSCFFLNAVNTLRKDEPTALCLWRASPGCGWRAGFAAVTVLSLGDLGDGAGRLCSGLRPASRLPGLLLEALRPDGDEHGRPGDPLRLLPPSPSAPSPSGRSGPGCERPGFACCPVTRALQPPLLPVDSAAGQVPGARRPPGLPLHGSTSSAHSESWGSSTDHTDGGRCS